MEDSSKNHDIVELVLQSLNWTLGRSEAKSPLDSYIAQQNQGLNKKERGWLLNILPLDKDSRPFLLLLFHCISAGNPNPAAFVKELSFAWGVSPATLRSWNEKTVSHLFGPQQDSQLLEAFKASLKFKVDIDDTESRNKVELYFERRENEDRYIEGWLHEQFFESDGEPLDLSNDKFKLPMLLQALCSGNPNGNFNALLGHAWGSTPPNVLLCAIETQFRCLLAQQETPSLLHDPKPSHDNDNVYYVVELVLRSLKWTLGRAKVKSPLDNYLALRIQGLKKEAWGWLLDMLPVEDDSRPRS
jgi:hypothetical protein